MSDFDSTHNSSEATETIAEGTNKGTRVKIGNFYGTDGYEHFINVTHPDGRQIQVSVGNSEEIKACRATAKDKEFECFGITDKNLGTQIDQAIAKIMAPDADGFDRFDPKEGDEPVALAKTALLKAIKASRE